MDTKAKIVVDGANVARWHGNNEYFSCRGILLCLAYFKKLKHDVHVFVPEIWRRPSDVRNLTDGEVLVQLYNNGKISYLPLSENDKENYDFTFLIESGRDMNAVVICNNNNNSNNQERFDEDFKKRILSYTFVEDNFYPDPNPCGMSLETFLTGAHLKKTTIVREKNKTNDELLASVLDSTDDEDGEYSSDQENSSSSGVIGKTSRNVVVTSLMKNQQKTKQTYQKTTNQPKYYQKNDPCNKKTETKQKKLTYGVGNVTKIEKNFGFIEAHGLKNQVKFTRGAYEQNQAYCSDLREIFSKNEQIVFSTGRVTDEGVMEASMVDRLDQVIHGYGKLVGDIRESTVIIESAKCDSLANGERIFCPGSAFKDASEHLKTMKPEDWVEFYAVEQFLPIPDVRKLKLIAVKANLLTVEGVFVKIGQNFGILWTKLVGLVFCSKSKSGVPLRDFKLGNWISCQVRSQSEKNNCKWYAISGHAVAEVASTLVTEDDQVEINCYGVLGVCTKTYGSVWSRELGRVCIAENLLQKCLRMSRMQNVSLKARYNYNSGSGSDYNWYAVEIQLSSLTQSLESSPDFVEGVRLTVDHLYWKKDKVSSIFFKSDKFGAVFARYVDCAENFTDWKPGEVVYGCLMTQELPNVVWRAFCVDKKPIRSVGAH